MKAALDGYLQVLADADASAVGGKLPADDDDGHPCRNPSQFHKHDQDGADDQLVGKGIQKLPEARNHIPLTGDMPV